MRNRLAIALASLSLLFSFVSCGVRSTYLDPEGPAYTGDFRTGPVEMTGDVRVVTHNIALGERTDLAIQEFRNIAELRNADIVLLQEMDPGGARTMAESLGYYFVYYPSVVHVKHGKDFGTAVLTRWHVTSHRKFLLPYGDPVRKSRRAITVAELAAGELEVIVCSVHTETAWMDIDSRVAQADSLVRDFLGGHEYAIVGVISTPSPGRPLRLWTHCSAEPASLAPLRESAARPGGVP